MKLAVLIAASVGFGALLVVLALGGLLFWLTRNGLDIRVSKVGVDE